MNLIHSNQNESVISAYRSFQYAKIDYLLDLGVKYLQNLGLYVDPAIYPPDGSGIQKVEDCVYSRISHFACTTYKMKIIDSKNNWFLYVSVPDLIQGTFFKLNQTYYVPILYLADEPIVLKENSITIQSLFQPITLYFKESRVIFMGHNIVLSDFFNFITYDWHPNMRSQVEALIGTPFNKSIDQLIVSFSVMLNCIQDYHSIKQKMNLLFFDPWTAGLYNKFYNVDTFDGVIQKSLFKRYEQIVQNKTYKFNDLRHKRLAFIEVLLKPYFKAISQAAKVLLEGNVVYSSKLKINEIVENFYINLHGNSLYDTTNGFAGILAHKATFKNPYGSGELPKEVSSIHWTHKNRICPNSISNHDSGQDIFLVPNQTIDLDYGVFGFSDEENLLES